MNKYEEALDWLTWRCMEPNDDYEEPVYEQVPDFEIEANIKPFKIGGWAIRSCEYGAYCAWMKEEKEMKETNLEHYKAELKEIFNKPYEEPKEIIKGIKGYIGETITYDFQSCTDAILNWMAQPYKKPILDEVERKYLSDVIRPFRKEVTDIIKLSFCGSEEHYISIRLRDESGFRDYVNLPNFKSNTMYKGMEINKEYTLKELGL